MDHQDLPPGGGEKDAVEDPSQKEDITPPHETDRLNVGPVGCERLPGLMTMGARVPDEKDCEERADREGPGWKQLECPEERDPAEVSQKEGRVSQWGKQAAAIAND